MMSTLLSIPLFQGLTKDELINLLEKVRPDFLHFQDEYILHQGDNHLQLLIILKGVVRRELAAADDTYQFRESMEESSIIEISTLFGRNTALRASYYAEGEVSLLAFDKNYLFSVFGHFDIVQLNLLNYFCAHAQTIYERQAARSAGSIKGIFCHFIRNLSESPHGEKQLHITRINLAELLGCNRRRMSEEIAQWEREGLLSLSYGNIVIPDLSRLEATINDDK